MIIMMKIKSLEIIILTTKNGKVIMMIMGNKNYIYYDSIYFKNTFIFIINFYFLNIYKK